MDEWWDDERDRELPVAVPHTELSAAALRGVIEYDTDRFEPATIARLAGHWLTLVDSMCGDASRPVSRLAWLLGASVPSTRLMPPPALGRASPPRRQGARP